MTLALPPVLQPIVVQLGQDGFRALVVGGAVRDALLGHDAKDIDVEVYGVSYDRLAEILSTHGRVDLVGISFGVIKFTPPGPPVDHWLSGPPVDQRPPATGR